MAHKKPIAYVVRHGAEYEPGNIFNSWIDAPLSAEGKKQEAELADFLKDVEAAVIFSSPLQRALRTANAINKHHKVPILQHRGLLGWGLGVFSGLPHEIGEDAVNLFVEHPDVIIPNGESLNISIKRIFDFADEHFKLVDEENPGIFVTHGHTIAVLDDLMEGKPKLKTKPKSCVKVGGVAGVYRVEGGYKMLPIFRKRDDDESRS